jgi:tetratricopeptide (TPR) repeat protein
MTKFLSIKACAAMMLAGTMACLAAPGCSDNNWANNKTPKDEYDVSAGRKPTAQTLFSLARILVSQGKDQEASVMLDRIIHQEPNFIPAYCELSEALMRQQDLDGAARVLSAGLKAAPRESLLWNNLGMCYLFQQKYDKALESFTVAGGIVPSSAMYRSNMATALGMQGRYEEALALYQQVLPMDEAHYNLGVVCQARNDMARAKQEFDSAAAANPQIKARLSATTAPSIPVAPRPTS